jgi:hypothetical protein
MKKKETHKEEEGKEGPTSFKDALLYYSLLARNKNHWRKEILHKFVGMNIDALSACSKRP